jgi:hypothetical protein
MATKTPNGTIIGPNDQIPATTGGSVTFFPNSGVAKGTNNALSPSPTYNSSLNGDSNVGPGGVIGGAQSSNNKAGGLPGSGIISYGATAASYIQNPANILNNFANGQNPFGISANTLGIDLNALTSSSDNSDTGAATTDTQGPSPNVGDSSGRRVRLRPKPAAIDIVYGQSPILSPLRATNGMIWPYQPTITYQQQVDYKSMELTHANQDIYAYHRTPSLALTVEGEWSVQNQEEGIYAMACIHFLRTVSKMNFGASDPYKGTPPPVLLFDAYGSYMFNQLPVIVTSFTISLPKDVDYVPIDLSRSVQTDQTTGSWSDLTTSYLNGRTQDQTLWLPAVFSISVGITVQNSPTKLRSFNLENFRSGNLVKSGGWV